MSHYPQYASELAADVSKQTERIILDQLGVLITEGLLVVETGPGLLVAEPCLGEKGMKVEYKQKIRLVLKDQQAFEALRKENAELKAKIHNMRSAAIEIIGMEKK